MTRLPIVLGAAFTMIAAGLTVWSAVMVAQEWRMTRQ